MLPLQHQQEWLQHSSGLAATTLHHWSGLDDGRLTQEELNTTFLVDDNFNEARKQVAATDVLAIDEIGMVSEVIFDKLEAVCKLFKRINRVLEACR